MTVQGLMPETAHCGGSANDEHFLVKQAAGAGRKICKSLSL